jgi:septum formation protein
MNFKHQLILASKSPRRQQILRDAGYTFEVRLADVKEVFPPGLKPEEVPSYLAKLKAEAFKHVESDEIVITADTVVILDGKILGKPASAAEAFRMIKQLSGRTHKVVTGVCLYNIKNEVVFSDTTEVEFKELTDAEIHYYVDNYKPLDKAGAYGIQEWLGFVGIRSIKGSFFNVMGLPIDLVFDALKKF